MSLPSVVVHIAAASEWRAAVSAGTSYRPDSLATEGFIHCSLPEQVGRTLTTWFTRLDDLVLVTIDAASLGEALVMEPGAGGEAELFPHIYGPLPLGSVIDVAPPPR